MIFSSVEFLALFMPLFLIAYLATPGSARNLTLCLGSWAFYAWWKPMFLPLIVGITFVAWALGKVIERAREDGKQPVLMLGVDRDPRLPRLVQIRQPAGRDRRRGAGVALHAGPIPWTAIILPIALSFTALQAISYLIDVRRGTVAAEPSFISFAAYLDMFPHLIAGPIIRYSWVDKDLVQRSMTFDDLAHGARRFMIGFAVKVLIADKLAPLVETVFALPEPDPRRCLARQYRLRAPDLLRFRRLQRDGDRPRAHARASRTRRISATRTSRRSIQDFWRRWHISLSSLAARLPLHLARRQP